MISINSRLGDIPSDKNEAYIPFLAAVETGILDLQSAKIHNPRSAGLELSNGIMPDQGGIIGYAGKIIGAYDLVAVEYASEKEVITMPTSRLAVDDQSDLIRGAGLVVYSDSEGLFKPVKLIDRPEIAEWDNRFSNLGAVAALNLWQDLMPFEIVDLDAETFEMRAAPITRYY